MTHVAASSYTSEFYGEQGSGSVASAGVVVPILIDLFSPTSVVDVGCGVAAWAAEFRRHGVDDVLGVDGPWVDLDRLLIPPACFQAVDLEGQLALNRTYDIAICLEVAEHLDEAYASQLVDSLATLAPVVVFSAAIPGQTGTRHVNEQWQSYWARLFMERGLSAHDCIRPLIWDHPGVQWWYAQNTIVYVADGVLQPRTQHNDTRRTDLQFLDLVHPRLWTTTLAHRESVTRPPRSTIRAMLSQVRRLFSQ